MVGEEITQIITSARKLGDQGFEDMEESDVNELLNSHSLKLSEVELEEMITCVKEDHAEEVHEEHGDLKLCYKT